MKACATFFARAQCWILPVLVMASGCQQVANSRNDSAPSNSFVGNETAGLKAKPPARTSEAQPQNSIDEGPTPFTIGDPAGFRLVGKLGGPSVMLTDGMEDVDKTGAQPLVIVAAGSGDVNAADRAAAARRTLASLPEVQDLVITSANPGATPDDYRIAAIATHHGRRIKLQQHMLFGIPGRYVRVVCRAPAPLDIAARCDRLAASIRQIATPPAASPINSAEVGAVFDKAGVLDADARSRLAATLGAFERKTGHGLLVITLSSLDGTNIDDTANSLMRRFIVAAKGRSDLILLVVAPHEHKVRIAVGQALVATVPDSFCRQVLDGDVLPAFKAGRIAGGIDAGVARLIRRVEGNS